MNTKEIIERLLFTAGGLTIVVGVIGMVIFQYNKQILGHMVIATLLGVFVMFMFFLSARREVEG